MPVNRKYYVLLFLITVLAFWPVALSVFSLKNDNLIYFLPYRYHISESIQHGFFPWWNPYLYTGIPIHSDIQSGAWNPVVLFISCFTTYNMTVLQWELTFYLLVAGIGLYKLARSFNVLPLSAFIASVAYVACGFISDSGSILPWIISAAYIPFVILYFIRLLTLPGWNSAIKLSLSLFLLLTAGYPSYFIFLAYLLLVIFICWLIVHLYYKLSWKKEILFLLVSVILFVIISGPVLLSWIDFLSYYDRGTGASLNKSFANSFPLYSSLSYLLPSAVSKDHHLLTTDLAARNASIGLFMFTFFIVSLSFKTDKTKTLILLLTLGSFLFSLGEITPVRQWAFRYIPLMDTFRHPATIRLFTSLGMILLGLPVLDKLLKGDDSIRKKILVFSLAIMALLAGLIVYFYLDSTLPDLKNNGSLKNLYDASSHADIGVIQATIQLLFIAVFILLITRKKNKYYPYLFIGNSLFLCWMALPFTFISQVRTSVINERIKAFPKGFPHRQLSQPIHASDHTTTQESFYNKNIVIQDEVITPTITANYLDFLNDPILRQKVNNYPLVYFSATTPVSISDNTGGPRLVPHTSALFKPMDSSVYVPGTTIEIVDFTPNKFIFRTETIKEAELNLFQQYHHGWNAYVDGVPVKKTKSSIAFISCIIPGGSHEVSFIFKPSKWVPVTAIISLVILLFCTGFGIFYFVKKKKAS